MDAGTHVDQVHRPQGQGVILRARGDLDRLQPAQIHPVERVDRHRTGAVPPVVAVRAHLRARSAAVHDPPLQDVGARGVQQRLSGMGVVPVPGSAAVIEAQQMADLVHVNADRREAVGFAVVPAAPALRHHVAVADILRFGWIVLCNLIHLRMQQARFAVVVLALCLGRVPASRIQVHHLVAYAPVLGVGRAGQVLDGIARHRRPAGWRVRRRGYGRWGSSSAPNPTPPNRRRPRRRPPFFPILPSILSSSSLASISW